MKSNRKREIFGWCMFDFANSSYTTIIITVAFAIVFSQFIVGPDLTSDNTIKTIDEVVVGKYVLVEGYDEVGSVIRIDRQNSVAFVNIADTEQKVSVSELSKITYSTGNLVWSITLILSYLLVVLTGPILGAIADFTSSKKKFLLFTYVICILFTFLLYFLDAQNFTIENGTIIWGNTTYLYIFLAIIFVMLSNFGFNASENFVSSFLPDLGEKSELGKISGYAWALGYFGGLFSIVIVMLITGLSYRLDNYDNLRLIGPITALFFMIAAIPTFMFLKERKHPVKKNIKSSILTVGFKRLYNTFRQVGSFTELAKFLVSFFFTYAGLAIVISFTSLYGAQEVNIVGGMQAIFFITLQITAAAGAFVFGFVQDRIGHKKAIAITIFIWITTIILIYYITAVTRGLNTLFGLNISVSTYFLVIGNFAGFCLGATQSASRALVGVFSPTTKSGEFFGFWGFAGKLASIVGILGFGLMQSIFDMRNAILICVVFFVAGLVVLLFVNEKRGIEQADEWKDELIS